MSRVRATSLLLCAAALVGCRPDNQSSEGRQAEEAPVPIGNASVSKKPGMPGADDVATKDTVQPHEGRPAAEPPSPPAPAGLNVLFQPVVYVTPTSYEEAMKLVRESDTTVWVTWRPEWPDPPHSVTVRGTSLRWK